MIVGPSRRSNRDRTLPKPLYHPPQAFSNAPRNPTKKKKLMIDTHKTTKRPCYPSMPAYDTNGPPVRTPMPIPRITTININDLSSEALTGDAIARRSQAADYLEDLLRNTDILAVQETGLRPGNKNYLQSRFPRSKINCTTMDLSLAPRGS